MLEEVKARGYFTGFFFLTLRPRKNYMPYSEKHIAQLVER